MAKTLSAERKRAIAAAAAAAAVAKQRDLLLHGVETEIFKLVSAGATPEQWAEWLRAPLEHAAASGNHGLFKRLVDAGATCGAGWKGCGGRTLLDAAAIGGDVDVVSTVLQKGSCKDVNVLATPSQRSALYAAVKAGHEAAARKLILAGADVNYEDPTEKCPPLVVAVRGGHGAVVTDLLLAGASPSSWVDDHEGRHLLQVAADRGDADILSALMSRNLDVNVADDDGYNTPLMLASTEGHLAVVNILLTAGADVSLRDGDGDTAFDRAAENGHTEVMQAILRHGVDVDARCPSGHTALHLAGSAGAVEMLLDAGADLNAKTDSGETPLHCAANCGNSEKALTLLLRGASVNAVDGDGNTPLHSACSRRRAGWETTVDILLKWGASEATVNSASQTPLQLLDTYVEGLRTSSSEYKRGRAAHETVTLEPVRSLLMRAPADRAWRRRCLLVMLRSRNDRERASPVASHHCSGATRQQEQEGYLGLAEEGDDGVKGSADDISRGAGESDVEEEEGRFGGRAGVEAAAAKLSRREVVGVVLELMPDPVFHTIVLFL